MAKNMPTGVKVISVLFYIVAVLALILGILALVGGGLAGSLVGNDSENAALGPIFAVAGVAAGVILIIIAVFYFFIGRGLWKGQNWARIVAIILAVIGLLSSLLSLIQGAWMSIIWLVVDGWIAWYLWFNKNVKKAF